MNLKENMRRFRTKNLMSEVASINIGGNQFTVTAANNGVNVQGGAINNNYTIEVETSLADIPVKIKDVSMAGGNVKITAEVETFVKTIKKSEILPTQHIAQIIDNIEAGKKEFRIVGDKNTFVFTQV